MSRGTFEVVLEAFANQCEIPQQLGRGDRPPVSVEKHLLKIGLQRYILLETDTYLGTSATI